MRNPTEHAITLRHMTEKDVPAVLDVQQPGAVLGLAKAFPQDEYPFPRAAVSQRWREEVATPEIDCFVVVQDESVVGFAAARADELMHFGITAELWGSGIAELPTVPELYHYERSLVPPATCVNGLGQASDADASPASRAGATPECTWSRGARRRRIPDRDDRADRGYLEISRRIGVWRLRGRIPRMSDSVLTIR